MLYARDHAQIATPIGSIQVLGDDSMITAIRIGADGAAHRASAHAVIKAAEQLESWFAGELRAFDIALAAAPTPRGDALRAALVAVGYGERLSYGALAAAAGSAARAIGQLCARNPFPVIIPCHRILPKNGTLGAYSAGSGPATKQWLLDHEQRVLGAST